ncbi:MAG TPA: ABC transporter substrate-binding protein [Smithellaceae bacterium]|nr:ABC transporter substrate-binding protein [Smithellaceae bacterium]
MTQLRKLLCGFAAAVLILAASFAHAANEIVIGFTGPLSGPAAEYGQDCVNGVDMAIKEINAAGGVMADGQKYLFRLEKMDDQVNPTRTVANARELLDKGALAIYNPVFGTAASLLAINEEECGEFILLAYTSSSKADEIKNNLLVVPAPPLTVYAKLYADWAWERGWRKAAMVVTLGSYGEEWRQIFKSNWEKLGGRITADKPANYYTRTDFLAPLKAALETNPDVMLIGGPSATTALVIEQARTMGYKGGFLLVDQAKMDTIAQMLDGTRLMENVIGTASVKSIPLPVAASFDKKYRDSYRRINTWEAVMHYVSMHALAKAIAASGTQDDVYAVRAAFGKAMPLLGDQYPGEAFGIAPSGRMQVQCILQTISGGKFSPGSAYIWWTQTPQEFENAKKLSKTSAALKSIKLK